MSLFSPKIGRAWEKALKSKEAPLHEKSVDLRFLPYYSVNRDDHSSNTMTQEAIREWYNAMLYGGGGGGLVYDSYSERINLQAVRLQERMNREQNRIMRAQQEQWSTSLYEWVPAAMPSPRRQPKAVRPPNPPRGDAYLQKALSAREERRSLKAPVAPWERHSGSKVRYNDWKGFR